MFHFFKAIFGPAPGLQGRFLVNGIDLYTDGNNDAIPRDEIKFISLEFCLLFTQILNRPVCPQPVTLCIRFVSSYKAVLSLSKKNDKSEGRVQNNVRFSS